MPRPTPTTTRPIDRSIAGITGVSNSGAREATSSFGFSSWWLAARFDAATNEQTGPSVVVVYVSGKAARDCWRATSYPIDGLL
jgi:hypothetical protein